MRKLAVILFCCSVGSIAQAMEFNPEVERHLDLEKNAAPSTEHHLDVDAALLDKANKVGKDGLTPVSEWVARRTEHGGNLRPRELNAVSNHLLNDLFNAPDRMNNTLDLDTDVVLEVSSVKEGGAAFFSGGDFITFAKDMSHKGLEGNIPAHAPLRELLRPSGTDADVHLFMDTLKDSVLKSPDKFEMTLDAPDGSKIRRVVAPDVGVGLEYDKAGKNPDLIRLKNEPLETSVKEPSPGDFSVVWDRAVERVTKFGKGIKDYVVGLGENGRLRIGKGLGVENATENLRYVELPTEDVKGFRRSMSEDQLRSVAGMTWEEASNALPGRHADKLAAVEQAWGAAATKADSAIIVMEPKAGSALEFAMNRTSPKEMVMKSKVDPVVRRVTFDWENPAHVDLLRTGRYEVHHADGYDYFFDKASGKPVSSDFDLATVGSKVNPGEVYSDKDLGYLSGVDVHAMNVVGKEFEARGYTEVPVAHGPQSNVGLPIDWAKDRMQAYLPGEARAYIIDSPKALADFLNVATEKGYKFRIPDQWGAQAFLKPSALKSVEVVSFEGLPQVGGKPKPSFSEEELNGSRAPPPGAPGSMPGKFGNEGKISTDVFYSAFEAPRKMFRRIGEWWQGEGIAQPKVEVVPVEKLPTPTGLGITPTQADKIQAFADKYQTRVVVVGSRAKNTARWNSDFDYMIEGNSRLKQAAQRELPRGGGGGEIRMDGTESGKDFYNPKNTPLNPDLPHVIFDPRKKR